MSNKLQVLDRIIQLEDNYEKELSATVSNKVKEDIFKEFGEYGLQIASLYYKEDTVKEDSNDCPECEEKAKKLIEKLQLASHISNCISNSDFDNYYNLLITKYHLDNETTTFINIMNRYLDEDWKDKRKILVMCLIRLLAEKGNQNGR